MARRNGMDPRTVRLDPGGERYFAVASRVFRQPGQESRGGNYKRSPPSEPLPDTAAEVDNSTCPVCGARRAFGCKHVRKGRS